MFVFEQTDAPYKVFTMARRAVHRLRMMPDNNDIDTRRTIHDCAGSLAFIPNEPKIEVFLNEVCHSSSVTGTCEHCLLGFCTYVFLHV